MTAHDDPLWQRLERFTIGPANAVLDFPARLARENGWSRERAERVVHEYLRFVYLAVRAGHPVTPSEEVDQAWHLHLAYTRSYWDELCGQVLGRPLHHGPTAGGLAEGERYHGQYERTLASYRAHFGEEPPADLWPPAEVRFRPPAARWVDTRRNLVLPRPRLPRLLRRARRETAAAPAPRGILGLAGVLLLTSCVGVLEWRGSSFLALFVALIPVAYLLAGRMALLLREEGRDAELEDPIELAFLGGGGARALEVAAVGLHRRGLLVVDRKGLRQGEGSTEGLTGFEEQVHRALPTGKGRPITALRLSLRPALERLRSELRRRGLVAGASALTRQRIVAGLPFAGLLVLGFAKVNVGVSREKPVGFLLVLLVVTFIAFLLRLSSLPRRTAAGERLWQRELREREARQARRAREERDEAGEELPFDVAVLGLGVLAGAGLGDLRGALRTSASSSTVGCGTGCTSSGSSGGGDGCGGGGCGGCGGCGG